MSNFEPTRYGLSSSFRLSSYGKLKESGCKVPESVVTQLFDSTARSGRAALVAANTGRQQETHLEELLRRLYINTRPPGAGVHHHLTIECRYPIIDDPYAMGMIICAEAVGDFYAMGITECEDMMLLICLPTRMTASEINVVVPLMEKGFNECFHGTTGPPMNWSRYTYSNCFMAGGMASAYWSKRHQLERGNAVDGDVLVLTKPLGTQVVIDAFGCIGQPERWGRYKQLVSENDVRAAYQQAVKSMCHPNRRASRLMHLHQAHGAIAVSGKGLLAHAKALALVQKQPVSFVIHTLPVFDKSAAICGRNSRLRRGLSAETSGGLLICMPRVEAVFFCKFLVAEDGHPAWIIGTVQSGNREVTINKNVGIIEVPDIP
ncbi:inactive selenide, water dikinase-like protein [Drosophila subobscura]|uniref:inactive selenide, water dikinase-like protein n=1 Tax=Drosophila subobscura TaxID=7241 RepID=UPI00155B285D|nr:inactive selenide, water dikinase-like protein [Drosophila subobscura]